MHDPLSRNSRTNIFDCGTISTRVLTSDNQPAGNATIELRSLETGASDVDNPATGAPLGDDCVRPGWYRITAESGTASASEDVQVRSGPQTVVLHLDHPSAAAGGGTVSATALAVPGKVRNQLRKARELITKLNYDAALRLIEKTIQIYPRSSEAYELRGLVSMIHHDNNQAMSDFQRSIQLDAGNALPRIMMGSALNEGQHFRQALVALQAALPLAPNSWQANYELGRAYAGVGNLREALRAFNRSMQLNPSFAPLRLARGIVLLRERQFADAVNDLNAFLRQAPTDPQAKTAQELLATAKAGEQVK